MTQFTIIEISKFDGSISGLEIYGAKIVWSVRDSKEKKIFLYEKNNIIELVETNGALPRISGNNMVWSAINSDGDSEIFLNDAKGTIQLTDNDVDDVSPQISDNNIVWSSDIFHAFRSAYVNKILLDNGQDVIQLNDNSSYNRYPVISGESVV